MHGMKRRRVPRELRNPITEAIRGSKPIQGKDLSDVRGAELARMDALCQGRATSKDWEHVVDLFKTAEYMAKDGIGVEVAGVANNAIQALTAAYGRAQVEHRWCLTPHEAWVLRDAWEYYDLQRQSTTITEYRKYLQKVADARRTGSNLPGQEARRGL